MTCEDLNGDVDLLLNDEAKKELDEHLDDLIASELNEEAEDDVFVAAFFPEGAEAVESSTEVPRVVLKEGPQAASSSSAQSETFRGRSQGFKIGS